MISQYKNKLSIRNKKKIQIFCPEKCILLVVNLNNNLRVNILDGETRGVLFWTTSGKLGFHSRQKKTNSAAKAIAEDCAKFLLKNKVQTLSIHVIGEKNILDEIIIECINISGCTFDKLVDVTPIKFAGCRPKGVPSR